MATSLDGGIEVRLRDFAKLDEDLLDGWRDLEGRAVESNAFLSPSFVLPAVEHLTGTKNVLLVVASRRIAGRPQICGLGVFVASRGSAVFPLPHLVAFNSIHSFQTGVLIDRTGAEAILASMLGFVRSTSPGIHGIRWPRLPVSGELGSLFQSTVERNAWGWHVRAEFERATLNIEALRKAPRWDSHVSSNRRKKYRRSVRGLKEHGSLTWELLEGDSVEHRNIDDFLRLEHAGWKSAAGSSILGRRDYREFFHDAVTRFQERGNLFLTELRLDDQTIASTCNFKSGRDGFAFKVGWDPTYRQHSPGIVNELMFLERTGTEWTEMRTIDSGAGADSFINAYWPDRRVFADAILSFGWVGRRVTSAIETARKFKGVVVQASPRRVLSRGDADAQ